jgi:hypothetical protein
MLLIFFAGGGGTGVVNNIRPAQIPISLLGTGVKILVRVNTTIKQRATTEGIPQVMINGKIQDLPSGGVLDS